MAKAATATMERELPASEGSDQDSSLLELMEAIRTIDERMERIKVFIDGGQVDGADGSKQTVTGLRQVIGILSQKVEALETAAINRDLKVDDPLPEDLYRGLTPASIFLSLMTSGFQALATTYPQVMLVRGNEGSRATRLADLVKACHHAVVIVAKEMPAIMRNQPLDG